MQSPYIPETPGKSPVIPEETPGTARPEVPDDPTVPEVPQDPPRHPDDPEGPGAPPLETPEALDVRIP